MTTTVQAIRPPLRVKIIYALGQLGWSLASFGAANLLVYFYMPPEGEQAALFPTYIYQGAILGIMTLIGLINFGGRVLDAITDPLIAHWSDQNTSKMGRRRYFMAISAVPFALFSFLVFYPPVDGVSQWNSIYLLVMVFLFFISLTAYVVPYTALISELGHQQEDRLLISTLVSVTWAVGFLIGNSAYALQGVFADSFGYSNTEALQAVVLTFSSIALVFMLIPVFFLNEKKYAYQQPSNISLRESVREIAQNINFRYFAISDWMYWLALTFIQLGVGYYVVTLLQLEEGFATLFLTIGLLGSFVLYVPVNMLAKRKGKKWLVSIGFVAFSVLFGLTSVMDQLPFPAMTSLYLLAILSTIPLAIFSILPNAIIADIIYQHEAESGNQQAGMFYAVRTFMMKLGISVANLIFPSLLLLGKSVDNPFGVKLSAVFAMVFCVVGLLVFLRYRE